ncbi:MAG: flagellar protein export ATPase FliI [Thiotrichaceae bacterium]|nr:flagellar protein export ATPase FliI [Thiotrichaceae bacterium]PCI15118.1 MAG: flagellar protein export ATPase FliI [Thiotrichales bacterium]
MHLRSKIWKDRVARYREKLGDPPALVVEGKLTRMVGLALEAVGCQVAVGGRCLISSISSPPIEAEVVGFSGDKIYLMPSGEVRGIVPNAKVVPSAQAYEALVGRKMLGRVIDGAGRPLDDKGPLLTDASVPLSARPMNPLRRPPIREPLDVGVRAINTLLTVGRGQRLGLFAGSGVGKSVLLGMMTRYTNADVVVVGLIGERGREVKEFTDHILGPKGMARAVVVATPADNPPLMRMHGAMLATSIAEYFRDQGKRVLLLMDSLTRYAQAQREIALAIGEPPATKGYPPSVFAKLPQLVERAGTTENGGSITAFYTVLAEGDDQQDPIADAARAILDGHFVLSRKLADAGHYPAIDIEKSISRVMTEIITDAHQKEVMRFKQLYSCYQQNKDLINVGAYTKGSDPEIDEAIEFYPYLRDFLQQNVSESVNLQSGMQQLTALLNRPMAAANPVMPPP